MKKVFIILTCILLITGCNKKEEEIKAFNCKLNEENEIYKKELVYNVQYKGDIITAIVSYEKLISDDTNFLNNYYEETKEKYNNLNISYGGHLYNVGKNNTNVTVEVSIDYNDVNMELLLENDSTLKDYVNNKNQITVDGIKEYYSSLGITCE